MTLRPASPAPRFIHVSCCRGSPIPATIAHRRFSAVRPEAPLAPIARRKCPLRNARRVSDRTRGSDEAQLPSCWVRATAAESGELIPPRQALTAADLDDVLSEWQLPMHDDGGLRPDVTCLDAELADLFGPRRMRPAQTPISQATASASLLARGGCRSGRAGRRKRAREQIDASRPGRPAFAVAIASEIGSRGTLRCAARRVAAQMTEARRRDTPTDGDARIDGRRRTGGGARGFRPASARRRFARWRKRAHVPHHSKRTREEELRTTCSPNCSEDRLEG